MSCRDWLLPCCASATHPNSAMLRDARTAERVAPFRQRMSVTMVMSDSVEPNDEGSPVCRRCHLFVELSTVFRLARRIKYEANPAALFGLIGKNVDQCLGDALLAVVVMHINMVDLTEAKTRYRIRQIREDRKPYHFVVDSRAHHLGGAILEQRFRIILVGPARRAALERLRVSGEQGCELARILQPDQ